MSERYAITFLARELKAHTGRTISYRRLWNACVDGRIAAEQNDIGRWTYNPADLPVIAAALGLAPAPPAASPVAA